MLYLKPGKMLAGSLCRKKDRDNAVAGTEIDRPLAFAHKSKPAQQHGIHAEAEPGGVLDYLEIVAFQVVYAFTRQ